MKIIENNYNNSKSLVKKPAEFTCEHCLSVIEVEPDELHEGWLGALYFTCPVCGKESMTDIEAELPTKDNIEFPKHFNKSSADSGAVDVSDENIQKDIRKLCNKLWDKTNEKDYIMSGTGNMVIFVENYAGDGTYKITVCKDYWEGEVKANPADDYYGGD